MIRVNGIGRRSNGFLSVTAKYDAPDEMEPLTEADDMKRIEFECHPDEPVKVLEDWDEPVHCLVCGVVA